MIGEDVHAIGGIAFYLDLSVLDPGYESFQRGALAECQTAVLVVAGVLHEGHQVVLPDLSLSPFGAPVQEVHPDDKSPHDAGYPLAGELFPVLLQEGCEVLKFAVFLPKNITQGESAAEPCEFRRQELRVAKDIVEHEKNQTDLHASGFGRTAHYDWYGVFPELCCYGVHVAVRAAKDRDIGSFDIPQFAGILVEDLPDVGPTVQDAAHLGCQIRDGLGFVRDLRCAGFSAL